MWDNIQILKGCQHEIYFNSMGVFLFPRGNELLASYGIP